MDRPGGGVEVDEVGQVGEVEKGGSELQGPVTGDNLRGTRMLDGLLKGHSSLFFYISQ